MFSIGKRHDKVKDSDASVNFSPIGAAHGATGSGTGSSLTRSTDIENQPASPSASSTHGVSEYSNKSPDMFTKLDSLKSTDSPGASIGHVHVDMRLSWDLSFVDAELEREYEKQITPRLCTMSIFPFVIAVLYSVYSACLGSIFDKEKTMLLAKMSQAPVIAAYNSCWIIVGSLSLLMVAVSWRGARFRAWQHAEWTVAVMVAIIIMLRVFLGNRWRIAQFFGDDPEVIFGAYSQDTELLLNHVMAVAYFGMYTPMRFRPFLFCCCCTSLVSFGASTAICGSPGDNWVRDFFLCLVVVGLLSVGKRELEKRHRLCWLQQRADRLHIAQLEQQSKRHKEKLLEQQEEQNFLQSHLEALSALGDPDRLRGSSRLILNSNSAISKEQMESPVSSEQALNGSRMAHVRTGDSQCTFSVSGSLNSTGGTEDRAATGSTCGNVAASLKKSVPPEGSPPVTNIGIRQVDSGPEHKQSEHQPAHAMMRRQKRAMTRVPNKSLTTLLARAKPTRWDLVKQCVRMLRNPYYSLKEFHEHVTTAFPELDFYKYMPGEDSDNGEISAKSLRSTSLHTADQEYQRTIGALYAIYWLMRIDMNGKLGFCFGHSPETMELNVKDASQVPSKPSEELNFFKMDERQKRANLYHTFPWERFTEVFVKSGCLTADMRVCEERCEAMLALTAIHDIFKNEAFLPTVADGHIFEGYTEGCVIQDHDQALNYILVHYPEALPSFSGLNHKQRKVVSFTQGKMGFNNGWLVQAEAPPKALFSTFKKLITSGGATDEDVSFYFVHWLTDLAGAVPTPLCGSEQFVLKFPDYVLAAFLRSFSYVWSLAKRSETEVMEDYLISSWVDGRVDYPVPKTEDAIAMMRLFLQAQRFGKAAVRAFQNLDERDKAVLTAELNKTGIVDQAYSTDFSARSGGVASSTWSGQQVPALLIYYGPALLQNNISLDENQSLKALAEVYRAARLIWPLEADPAASKEALTVGAQSAAGADAERAKQEASEVLTQEASRSASAEASSVDRAVIPCTGPSVVTIRVEQLKDLVANSQQMDRFEGWFLVKKNAQEGVVARHSLEDINGWNDTMQVYRYLHL